MDVLLYRPTVNLESQCYLSNQFDTVSVEEDSFLFIFLTEMNKSFRLQLLRRTANKSYNEKFSMKNVANNVDCLTVKLVVEEI